MSLILSVMQIIEITDKRTRPAQARVLKALGIPFSQRPDKSIVIFTKDVSNHAPETNKQRPPKLRLR